MSDLEQRDAELKSANDVVTKWAGDVKSAEAALAELCANAGRLAVDVVAAHIAAQQKRR